MRLRVIYEYGNIRILHHSGVASPDEYGAFLAAHLPTGEGMALDLTTGSGFHAIVLYRLGFTVTAVDINSFAIEAARANAILNGADLTVLQGDLYGPVAGQRFGVIVSCPPFMPVSQTNEPPFVHTQINDGGVTGFDVVERVLAGARQALAPAGRLFSVRPWYLDETRYERLTKQAGLQLRTLATERFPLGTLSAERLPYLCRISGRTEEELCSSGQEMHVVEMTAAGEESTDGI